ncbi:heat-inducible transcription repressor HrcA [Deferribacter desulfuricans SSM1]|uniref:Heat-inducible transcription repressor HrcA n=1 Tax=Deferribacter desulfuricans (strain DSM 14783 / JCM 11476 / NBRC 101012 / SSM1) TaxID=639282 RepID=D3PA24_DEFDS|nr:heat-inducible transcriptional repressor HrcA [Deferribacter desulfuricans]BAI81564.1 heat-inducible transcription repressor HrcA [Deferribacter desulfuricans SSM1]
MDRLDEREEIVLKIIVDEYIDSSEPVGSRLVSRVGPLKLSPASIRNIMSDLEEKGYIYQPHTSAGRVPTDLGYRYYIDRFVTISSNNIKEDIIKMTGNIEAKNIKLLFKEVTKQLSKLTHSVGFVVSPNTGALFLKHLEFLKLNKYDVLAILVTKTGIVQNVILHLDVDIPDNVLQRISNYINEHFEGASLLEVRERIFKELEREKQAFDNFINSFKNYLPKIFEIESIDDGFYYDGTSNILDLPEFSDVNKLKEFLKTFEEKTLIYKIVDKCVESDSVQIFIGSEIGEQNSDVGLVVKPYKKSGKVLGTLGIIGPKRMKYPKVVPIVDYTANLISEVIERLGGKDE